MHTNDHGTPHMKKTHDKLYIKHRYRIIVNPYLNSDERHIGNIRHAELINNLHRQSHPLEIRDNSVLFLSCKKYTPQDDCRNNSGITTQTKRP